MLQVSAASPFEKAEFNNVVQEFWPEKPCDTMLVSSPSFEGEDFMCNICNICVSSFFKDILGRSAIIFENIQHLLKADNIKLQSLMVSIPCLVTIIETYDIGEASKLIDFLADLGVKEKHLLIYTPFVMNTELLPNKTINFNVIIIEKSCDAGE